MVEGEGSGLQTHWTLRYSKFDELLDKSSNFAVSSVENGNNHG